MKEAMIFLKHETLETLINEPVEEFEELSLRARQVEADQNTFPRVIRFERPSLPKA
jgi:hypothetical protein